MQLILFFIEKCLTGFCLNILHWHYWASCERWEDHLLSHLKNYYSYSKRNFASYKRFLIRKLDYLLWLSATDFLCCLLTQAEHIFLSILCIQLKKTWACSLKMPNRQQFYRQLNPVLISNLDSPKLGRSPFHQAV